jgi:type I restriction enzyme S subunit
MLPKYERYKDTPALWIDTIPNEWQSKKIREIFTERRVKVSDKDYAPLSVSKAGIVPQLSTAVKTDNGDNRKLVKAGDFVINSRSDRKGSSGVSPYDGSVSLINIVLSPTTKENSKYIHYLLRSVPFTEEYYRNGRGLVSDLWTTRYDELKNIFVPIPPREEQDQIARFLDWKTSEMTMFIREKRQEIRLLKEYRDSQINALITNGTSPSVYTRDSGIDWVGNIPEHWRIEKIQKYFSVHKRIAGKEGYDVLSITQQGIKVKDISSNEGQMAQSYANYQFVYPGDFAMNHMDLITGYVDCSTCFGVTSPDYRVFCLDDPVNCFDQYYLRVFQLGYKRRIFYKFGKGAASKGRWRLPKQAFMSYEIPVPPYDEQVEIVRQCKEVEDNIGELITNIEKEIRYVQELLTTTIADAVTGMVDVRNVKIPEFEQVSDSEDDELKESNDESVVTRDEEVDE